MNTTPRTEATHSRAHQAFDDLAGSVRNLRHEVVPLLDRAGGEAAMLARRSLAAVRQRSHRLQDQALRASDRAARSIRNEPLKSVLIAAVAGAVLVALVDLGRHFRNRR